MQLSQGQTAPTFKVNDIWGNSVDLAKIENKKVLLSFFRYAECAVCQLRIVEIMREKERFKQQDIAIIAIFQSPPDSLKTSIVDKTHFDFTIIADPEKVLYQLYSVKPSWIKMMKTFNLKGIKRVIQSMKAGFKPGGKVEGQIHQIPADFILDRNKKILVSKYGDNVADHIPLNEIFDEQNSHQ